MSPAHAVTTFPSGAMRERKTGKGRFDLLPPLALERLARHFEAGAVRHGDRNWEQGIPLSSFFDSALRHVFQYLSGDATEDHLVAATWNLLAALETEGRALQGRHPRALLNLGPHQE